jgi:hypothetical protein
MSAEAKIGLASLIIGIIACIGTYLAIPEIKMLVASRTTGFQSSFSTQATSTPSPIPFWAEDFPSRIHAKEGNEFIIPFKIHVNPRNQSVTFEPQAQIFRKDTLPDKSYIYLLGVEPSQATISAGESRSFKSSIALPEGYYHAVLQYWTTRDMLINGQKTTVRMPQEFTDVDGDSIEISIEIVK